MTIAYRNTFRDRFAFASYMLPRQPVMILMFAGFVLLVTFQFILPAVRGFPGNHTLAARIFGFVFLELLLLALLVVFFAVITVLTMISAKNKALYSQRTLTIGSDVIVTESEYGRSEAKWAAVQKLVRTRAYIFMYFSQQSAVVIPRRAFQDLAQWDAFYDACKQAKGGAS